MHKKNIKTLVKLLGFLILLESVFMVFPIITSLLYEGRDLMPFLKSLGITVSTGLFCYLATLRAKHEVNIQTSYLLVALTWLVFSLFGALPFYFSGDFNSYTDAFFETISGFTTTGASILNNIEELSHAALFWRSLIQWMGGMGIIVLTIAILPMLGVGGMQLYSAESPGFTTEKIHPKISEVAKKMWYIYCSFTAAEVLLLYFGDMNLFDAICHSLTTMATGGYSTKQASIAHWDSPYIHYVITFFMCCAGINFSILYLFFHGKFRQIIIKDETKWYLGTIWVASFVIFATLYFVDSNAELERTLRDAVFQVVSIITTTGYATADYMVWPKFLIIIVVILMVSGGSTGSTAGGVKVLRLKILLKNSVLEIKRILHPHAVIPVRMDGKAVKPKMVSHVLSFMIFYFLISVIGLVVISINGTDFETAFGSVVTCLSNVGPGLGSMGPSSNFALMSDLNKWVLSIIMVIGRLEIFTFIIIFFPSFWKR